MDQGNILKSLEILPWGGYNMTLQNQINLDSSIQDIKKNLGKGKTKQRSINRNIIKWVASFSSRFKIQRTIFKRKI